MTPENLIHYCDCLQVIGGESNLLFHRDCLEKRENEHKLTESARKVDLADQVDLAPFINSSYEKSKSGNQFRLFPVKSILD